MKISTCRVFRFRINNFLIVLGVIILIQNLTKIFGLELIYDVPALRIRRTLIIADPHIGYSTQTYRYSTRAKERISMYQALSMFSMISATKEEYMRRLIILGDIKESIGVPRKFVLKAIQRFLTKLTELFKQVIIVRGNHDGKLIDILDELDLEVSIVDHISLRSSRGRILITHGHMKAPYEDLMAANIIIIGHIHPTTDIDKVFVVANYVLRDSNKILIIVPTINPMLQGIAVNCNIIKNTLIRISPPELQREIKLKKIRLLGKVTRKEIPCDKII